MGLLRQKAQLKAEKGVKFKVRLSNGQAQNKYRITKDPCFHAAVKQVLQTPMSNRNNIKWQLDRCVLLLNGAKSVWS